MDLLKEAKHGKRVLRINFPTGESIPFVLLSWRDFKMYKELYYKGTIPEAILENAIFEECVLDKHYISNMHDGLAGIVSTVVGLILAMSGPSPDANVFNETLDLARREVDTIESQLIMTICQAFPAYSPEDIQKLPWKTILVRAAQAERILLSGGLQEPLRAVTQEELAKLQKQQPGMVDVNKLVRNETKEMVAQGVADAPAPRPGERNQQQAPVSAKHRELLRRAKALREQQANTGHI